MVRMMRSNSPEQIVDMFFKARPNVSDIQRLRQVTGKPGFKALKQAWLEDMFTQGENMSFSPAKFASSYEKYRRGGNLNAILDQNEREGLDKLYEISKLVNTAEKLAGNPSGTAQNEINALWHWARHPVAMTVAQMNARKFAKLYFNNSEFQKALIEGLESTAYGKKAGAIANQMSKIIAVEGQGGGKR